MIASERCLICSRIQGEWLVCKEGFADEVNILSTFQLKFLGIAQIKPAQNGPVDLVAKATDHGIRISISWGLKTRHSR